jgi:hypothetical protein
MHRKFILLAILILTLAGTGCPNDGTSPPGKTGNPMQRMDQFCTMPGMSTPFRQTFILIDEKVLLGTKSPKEFNEKNARTRDAVLAFTDPALAVEYGKSAARERVTLMLAPADGSAPKKIFTGCLPALSSADRQKIKEMESSMSNFFTGGSEQDINEAASSFRSRVVASLLNAAKENSFEPPSDSRVFQSLAAGGSIYREVQTVPRIIIISDHLLDDVPTDLTKARQAGLIFGAKQKTQLGNAEILVVGDGSQSESARGYLSSAFLAMGANLNSWSQDSESLSATPAPTKILRYSGETFVVGTSYREIINIRIALDQNNQLVNSWAILPGSPQGIPMTGGGVCKTDGSCELRSDSGLFAQAWIASRGTDPAFDDAMPFGGMRSWELSLKNEKLHGRIYDAAIARVVIQGQDDFKIEASLVQNADF